MKHNVTENKENNSNKLQLKLLFVFLIILMIALVYSTNMNNTKAFCRSDLPENIATCIQYKNSESIIIRNLKDVRNIMKQISQTDSVDKRKILADEVMSLAASSYLELERLLKTGYLTKRTAHKGHVRM